MVASLAISEKLLTRGACWRLARRLPRRVDGVRRVRTLDTVKQRGPSPAASSTGLPGFSEQDARAYGAASTSISAARSPPRSSMIRPK